MSILVIKKIVPPIRRDANSGCINEFIMLLSCFRKSRRKIISIMTIDNSAIKVANPAPTAPNAGIKMLFKIIFETAAVIIESKYILSLRYDIKS